MYTRWSDGRWPLVVGFGFVLGLGGLCLTLSACSQFGNLKARKLFKDANVLYTQQDYKRSAEKYEETLQADPNYADAYFYLGNSYDNLYKPARQGEAENDSYLQKAINNYKLAAERHTDPKMKTLALQYLVAAYGPDKLNDPSQAEPIIQRMMQLDPTDPDNYFALAKLYEDAGRYEEAEQVLLKAKEARPNDSNVYMQLAGFYNRQGEFEKTIESLQQRAQREPNNPEVYYTISVYYWDKASRDFTLKEPDKKLYVQKGLEAVNKSLGIKDDYMEAVVYKGLLLRTQATLEKEPARQQALIKEAEQLQLRARELQKKRVAGVGE